MPYENLIEKILFSRKLQPIFGRLEMRRKAVFYLKQDTQCYQNKHLYIPHTDM